MAEPQWPPTTPSRLRDRRENYVSRFASGACVVLLYAFTYLHRLCYGKAPRGGTCNRNASLLAPASRRTRCAACIQSKNRANKTVVLIETSTSQRALAVCPMGITAFVTV